MIAQWCRRLARPVARRVRAWRALQQAHTEASQRIALLSPRRLLVVCYGNIYRSPFVAAALTQSSAAGVEIRSAGFHPRIDRETPGEFQTIASNYGIDLRSHRSRLIDAAAVNWADVILVMDRHNWDRLAETWPHARSKIVWLGGLLDNGSAEIIDPYGRSEAEMKAIADRLYRATQILQKTLISQRKAVTQAQSA